MTTVKISCMLLLLFYSSTSTKRIEIEREMPEDCEDMMINQFLENSRTTHKPITTTRSILDQYPVVNLWPKLKMFPKKSELLKEIRQKTEIDKARRMPDPNSDCGDECGNFS
ncbi:uncharacterized protein LOC123315192 [Coccinella septempunctata]|uniref:uncharacterized protein LOC123315192 n=1 Tax=Coccinella septempunctata TaxID=41139 RepID=UPI001D06770D|nr:uncharacterized protein LOC123315192 [Coccinella septempunctata]